MQTTLALSGAAGMRRIDARAFQRFEHGFARRDVDRAIAEEQRDQACERPNTSPRTEFAIVQTSFTSFSPTPS